MEKKMNIKVKAKIVFLIAAIYFSAARSQFYDAPEFHDLAWQTPPSIGKIGDKGVFKITEPYVFLNDIETNKFLVLNGNLPHTNSYTIANKKSNWFGILQFVNEGYVKDDEKIDPDALLASLKEGNRKNNEEKRKQGLVILNLEGWYFPPRYDYETKRIEWGTKLRSETDNSVTINVTTKILGRSGHVSAILVSNPEELDKDIIDFKLAIKNFDYISGEKYSEWTQGDRVAAYGLGALVLGGAAAAAMSKGGFKLIWIAIVGIFAAVWAGIKKLFERKK